MGSGGDIDFVIDLETSTKVTVVNGSDFSDGKKILNKGCSGLVVCDGPNRGDESLSFENRLDKCVERRLEDGETMIVDRKIGGEVEKLVGVDKPKKKGFKKPPRPPRPPRPLSVDLADQKLINEISELAMLKRARVERMRALKKTKNGKAASTFTSNSFALVITLIFCVVVFWQGIFSRGSSGTVPQGSPQSMEIATGSRSSFISVQLYSNASTNTELSAASPRDVEFASEREQSIEGWGTDE